MQTKPAAVSKIINFYLSMFRYQYLNRAFTAVCRYFFVFFYFF